MYVARLTVNAERPDPLRSRQRSKSASGGVVAFPTDTLYGLAVDPRSAEAVERLFALKARDRNAAVPLVAADVEQAMTAGEFGPRERRIARAFWPGPLSVVVPARLSIARTSLGGGSTVAVRVPAHAVARGWRRRWFL